MDPGKLQEIAERDQLWASLRALVPEIQKLADGEFSNTERERQLVLVISRIVVLEMHFRADRVAD